MSEWKAGNEFLPYHPSASHVNPDYRDGWNACYRAALDAGARPPNSELMVAWLEFVKLRKAELRRNAAPHTGEGGAG